MIIMMMVMMMVMIAIMGMMVMVMRMINETYLIVFSHGLLSPKSIDTNKQIFILFILF